MIPAKPAASRKRPSRKDSKRALGWALALGLGAATPHAAAVTCSVSTPGIAFGAYDVFAAAPINANGTLKLTCSLSLGDGPTTVRYKYSLSTGSSGSFVQRDMQSGANKLGYNLYTSNAYSVVWGDGTGTSATISSSMRLTPGNPTDSDTRTVYGRIPALQDAGVGPNYLDNVTVTVTF